METAALVEGVLAGERRPLARLLSAVEAGDEHLLRQVIAAIHPHAGRAHTIGITGSPGVGKSTLTARLIADQRQRGATVAVLAIDPSSPFSGGALLGDRVRMGDQAVDEGVFIRSMATRGHLGGLSWATPPALTVLDAAGFDVVIIETVGVGQAEVEIASLADSTVVVLAPGMGDAVQAAKAGILEIADVFVVNKADMPGARKTSQELLGMQYLSSARHGWVPPVLQTVADQGKGIPPLSDALAAHLKWSADSGQRSLQQRHAARVQIREIVLQQVRSRMHQLNEGTMLEEILDQVVARQTDPYSAADALLEALEA
ncbi:MAG: methylmalonyl Co-A mutase-associated GTPase MeaB [Euzebya sp.]